MLLKDKVAVITGAARGIGLGLAQEAAAKGMKLALIDIDEKQLVNVAEQLSSQTEVYTVAVDVRSSQCIQRCAQNIFLQFGEISLLFINAGVIRTSPLTAMLPGDIDDVIDVNFRAAIYTVNAFAGRMSEQNSKSHIVFTGSQASLLCSNNMGVYSATKHAVWSLAETLKLELDAASAPVGVSLLCPGSVSTDMLKQSRAKHVNQQTKSTPENPPYTVPTILEPRQVAKIVFDGIQKQKFWIFTHPSFKSLVRSRFESILDERDPPLFRGWEAVDD